MLRLTCQALRRTHGSEFKAIAAMDVMSGRRMSQENAADRAISNMLRLVVTPSLRVSGIGPQILS